MHAGEIPIKYRIMSLKMTYQKMELVETYMQALKYPCAEIPMNTWKKE